MYITFKETCVCTCMFTMLYKYNSHILVSNEVYIVCVNVHVSQKSHLAPEIHCNFCLLNTLYSKVYVNLCINPVLLIQVSLLYFKDLEFIYVILKPHLWHIIILNKRLPSNTWYSAILDRSQ